MERLNYREVTVKGILNPVRGEDDWFGLSYNMNLYRGCEHQCIYCDTRSACYQIENFDEEVLVKINALELLEEALPHKRKLGVIGFGSMNDPYTYAEDQYGLTGKALEIVAKYRFPVHIITKSDRVLKDLATLKRINQVKARVSFTLTTTDDALAARLEPGAPSPTRRLAAMAQLAEAGIETGVVMMPILPFIEDSPENIEAIVLAAATHGAAYIIPSFGVTVREGQREHFYRKLDEQFSGVRQQYERTFGTNYFCPARNARQLEGLFTDLCTRHNIATRLSPYPPKLDVEQPPLF
ncbi:MAG: radical SAM protein [Anaerolineaceae bacterium]|nr:radical SAM protein [Anaerolineaceae bacterium]